MNGKLANKLAIKHIGGPLKAIEPIVGGGEVNKVYIIKSDTCSAVLRVHSAGEFERFQKESWCIEQSIAVGVSGAKVYEVNKTRDYAYMLIEFIAGSNGNKIVASPELWEELGKYLKLIHKIPVKGFGEKLDDIIGGNKEQWNKYLQYNVESLNDEDKLIRSGMLDNSTSIKLKAIFLRLFSKDFAFGLNHGDYSLANAIVDEQSVIHVIDWGSAQAHIVPHHDLGVILEESLDEDSEEFNALINGYGMRRNDFGAIRSEIADLMLLEAVDKLRWALDKAPEWVESHKKRLIKLLQTA
jgi:aminoglycoside phosphotransferase (APT) family kinase protein